MYRRKVQVTGGATFFVTLPKEWAQEVGLVRGSLVSLLPSDSGALLLVPPPSEDRNSCSIALGDWDFNRLQRETISRYIAGYDIIKVTGERIGQEQRRMVREIAQGLIGLEIFEETQGTVVLHSLVNMREFPVQRTLHRIFDMAQAMLADAVAAFVNHDQELARDVVERDADVDRLVLLVARQFGLLLRDLLAESEVELSRLRFLHFHTVADQLERVADHAAKISQAALTLGGGLKPSVTKKVTDLASASASILTQAVEAFEALDEEKANAVLEEKAREHAPRRAGESDLVTDQPESAHAISIVMDSLLRVREYGFNIAENALDAQAVSPDFA